MFVLNSLRTHTVRKLFICATKTNDADTKFIAGVVRPSSVPTGGIAGYARVVLQLFLPRGPGQQTVGEVRWTVRPNILRV